MSKEENFSFSINNMRESIDRMLSGQRRRYVLRFIITFNVIYTIVVGIVVFHKGLKVVYIIHQYFTSSDSEFSPEFLLSGVGVIVCVPLIHIELNLVFMSLFVAQNLHYRQTAQKNVIQ
jgi:hypothetical protein